MALLLLAGAAAADRRAINPDSAYPEGPLYRDGALYYAEMGNDRVMRWDGATNTPFWSRPGCWPTGLAAGRAATLVVLCHREGSIARVDLAGNTLGVVAVDEDGGPFVTPNAAASDGAGGVYFSSSGSFAADAPATGAILHFRADGALRRVAEGIHYANGVAVDRGRGVLFVSEHLSRNVLAFDIGEDGALFGRRVFVRLDDLAGIDADRGWEVGPDGLQVDREGNLYIAEYGAGHVLIVDAGGRLIHTIEVPERYVTGVAFSPDQTRVFVTAPASMAADSGAVYETANPVRLAD